MSTVHATAESIRAALSSPSTCTPATVTTLSELLLPKPEVEGMVAKTKPKGITNASATSMSKATRTPAPKSRAKKGGENRIHEDGGKLSPKEAFILATEVINATLKHLSDAIKAPVQTSVRRQSSSMDLVKASARKALRRSNSLPLSPLQPRSLNRVTSSPSISARESRSSSSASINTSTNRPIAECARVGFACLRTLHTLKVQGMELPPLQLENGMSALIGKLVSLGLEDLAVKELRILKRRLDSGETSKGSKSGSGSKTTTTMAAPSLASLLDFGIVECTGPKLGLVITTQLQVLRLMTSCRKPKQAEDALPILKLDHPSSPTRLLLMAAKESRNEKQTEKFARQLQTLSELILSLCPSLSTTDDALALETRVSVRPEVAIQIQTLALHDRFLWWDLAKHQGDMSKDIYDPFLRCLSAFTRRSECGSQETYKIALMVAEDLLFFQSDCAKPQRQAPKMALSGIYRLLGSLSREADRIEDAIKWTKEMRELLDARIDSDTKRCSVIARLTGLTLRKASGHAESEELLFVLLEELDRPFKGESSEIDELMSEVSGARRSAISILAQCRASSEAGTGSTLSDGMRQMCESLVFLCPRLALRYLGNPANSKSTNKDVIRHEQRRQFITKLGLNAIDSVLFLIKMLVGEDQISWDLVDSKLQDCLLLLDRLCCSGKGASPDDSTQSTYYARISNLYFAQFLNMRRSSESAKDGQQMRAVRRSIDCIRARPKQEKRIAQFTMKLERMAEFCKAMKRYDEVHQTLLMLRDEMIEDGVLSAIVKNADSNPLCMVWDESDESRAFGRMLESLLKIELKYLKSASQGRLFEETWSEDERATILEYQLGLMSKRLVDSEVAKAFQIKLISELLSIYDDRRYPLRRLRVIIRLLGLDFDCTEEGVRLLEHDLEPSWVGELVIDDTHDEGLKRYGSHLKALVTALLQLRRQRPSADIFKAVLSAWSGIMKRCETPTALEHEIDDVPGLLVQLQAITDFLNMKGHDTLALATLRLSTGINNLYESLVDPDDLVTNFVRLGAQWLRLGYTGKAGLALDRATAYSSRDGVTSSAKLHCRLSYCEYLLALGSYDKVQENLNGAQQLYSPGSANFSASQSHSTPLEQTRMNVLTSHAYIIHAMLAYERGAAQTALSQAKQSVRILRRAWAVVEEQERKMVIGEGTKSQTEVEKLTQEVSQLNISTISIAAPQHSERANPISGLWLLVSPLFRGLTYLSQLFAHNGMFQEMIYYAEQAQKVAQIAESEVHLALASLTLGNAWLRSEILDKGSEFLMSAKKLYLPNSLSRESAILSYHLGIMHGLLGDPESEFEAYNAAEKTLKIIIKADHIDLLDKVSAESDILAQKITKLTITKQKAPSSRKVASRAKPTSNSKTNTRARSPVEAVLSMSEDCHQLTSFLATVLRQKAHSVMAGKSTLAVDSILEEAARYDSTQIEIVHQGLATARRWLLESVEQMDADPVYSVLQDSTISFPSVFGQLKTEKLGDRISAGKTSPQQKVQVGRGNRDRTGTKSPVPGGFVDKLRQAHELLMDISSIAIHIAPVPVNNKVSALLNSVAILLSAVGQTKGRSLTSPLLASSSIETARTLALRRERKAILADPCLDLKSNDVYWPQTSLRESRRSSIGLSCDVLRFQREYIDIIPKSWTVVSISLGDNRQELCISKLQAGVNPFILRLPLGRHNSMDADEEVFGFEQGRAELMEILALANESSHDASSRVSREDKKAWWEERESLDSRLRDLLENVEKVWLGGFTGIFSQHARRPDLLARFQKSFSNILDRHLPSRRKTGRRNANPRVTLDSRILDLFIGLGDASDDGCDLAEPLTDLLYFVIDVLQFHGELNAYAEIDFDSIVVETHDALRSYHAAVHSAGYVEENRHTILVLDKALHSLPWESLPCMDGLAVSRVPSLGCLRDRILARQKSSIIDAAEGHYISRAKGSYILNPEGDLKNTQATFQKTLEKLDGWQGIANRSPSEEELKEQLLSKDIFLYFGHGSGAQYIRAKEIKKLETCAVAMLMGCSSGALIEAGEFEPHGPPINYMHAGCPALVATLWDVTDKDIDRFAKSTFENWGLFEPEAQSRGKGRKKAEETPHNVSLSEAVAKGRAACNLRYLNGASVCIYGVPVYLD